MANEVDAIIHQRGMAWLERHRANSEPVESTPEPVQEQDELVDLNHNVNSPNAPHNLK